MANPNGAETFTQKRDILSRLLTAWASMPEMRLGQFLSNAGSHAELFYIEDKLLIKKVEEYVNKFGKKGVISYDFKGDEK